MGDTSMQRSLAAVLLLRSLKKLRFETHEYVIVRVSFDSFDLRTTLQTQGYLYKVHEIRDWHTMSMVVTSESFRYFALRNQRSSSDSNHRCAAAVSLHAKIRLESTE